MSHGSVVTEDGACLDVTMYGFWGGRFEKAYVDVKVFNPCTRSNQNSSLGSVYQWYEQEKRRQYEQRVRKVEHATLTPLVMSSLGGICSSATTVYKRLASVINNKRNVEYTVTIN